MVSVTLATVTLATVIASLIDLELRQKIILDFNVLRAAG